MSQNKNRTGFPCFLNRVFSPRIYITDRTGSGVTRLEKEELIIIQSVAASLVYFRQFHSSAGHHFFESSSSLVRVWSFPRRRCSSILSSAVWTFAAGRKPSSTQRVPRSMETQIERFVCSLLPFPFCNLMTSKLPVRW